MIPVHALSAHMIHCNCNDAHNPTGSQQANEREWTKKKRLEIIIIEILLFRSLLLLLLGKNNMDCVQCASCIPTLFFLYFSVFLSKSLYFFFSLSLSLLSSHLINDCSFSSLLDRSLYLFLFTNIHIDKFFTFTSTKFTRTIFPFGCTRHATFFLFNLCLPTLLPSPLYQYIFLLRISLLFQSLNLSRSLMLSFSLSLSFQFFFFFNFSVQLNWTTART